MRHSEIVRLALLEAERLGDTTVTDIETIDSYATVAKIAFAVFLVGLLALIVWALLW